MAKIKVLCILDRSGSMGGSEEKVISSFNEFIQMQRTAGIDADVSLFLFDNQYETVFKNVPLDAVQPLTKEQYYVRGMTALNDAVGKTISEFSNEKNVFFFVDTDGAENASREYKSSQLRDMIKQKSDAGWDFVFVGADLSSEQTASMASDIGILKSAAFDKSDMGYNSRTAFVSNSVAAYSAKVEADLSS